MALSLDTIIQTPYGPKKITDIKVGDEVFGWNGVTNITNISKNKTKEECFAVTFADKTFVECPISQIWYATSYFKYIEGLKIPKFKNLKLVDMMESGLKFTSKMGYKYTIPMIKSVNYWDNYLPLHPYLMGLLLGDGTLGSDSTIYLAVSNAELELIDIIKTLIPDGTILTSRDYPGCKRISFTSARGQKNPVTDVFRELKLKVRGDFKFIPDIYKYSSEYNRLELLKGLMDSDGSFGPVERLGARFSNNTNQLCDDICEIVRSLGGVAIKGVANRIDKGIEYNVNVKTFFNPFKQSVKANKWRANISNIPHKRIYTAENIGLKTTFNLDVSADDNLFLSNQFIVTHGDTL